MSINDFELISDWPDCDFDVVGFIIQDRLGRVGCQLRDDFDFVKGAGKWTIFGGHVEHGETYAQTAIREMKEETGLIIGAQDLVPYVRLVPPNGLPAHHYYFHVTKTIEPSDMQVFEGAGFAFLHHAQYQCFDFLLSARMVLDHMHRQNKFA